MSRRNLLKDSQTIYYAYRLGLNERSQEVFDDIKETKAYVADRTGSAYDSRMGTEASYDLQFIVNATDDNKKIDQYTRVWINTLPRVSDDKPDYEIVSKPTTRNGQILVSCRSTATNYSEFYYEHNGEILRFMAIDDLANLKFIVPINMYLPIDFDTKLWYDVPDDVESTDYAMAMVGKEEVGKYVEYTVELK